MSPIRAALAVSGVMICALTLTAQIPVRTVSGRAVTLSENDLSQIVERARPLLGRDVWLVQASASQGCCSWNAHAYGAPEQSTTDIRRGRSVSLRTSAWAAPPPPGNRSWALLPDVRSPEPLVGHYAQVALAGRDFNDVQGLMDENLPFAVSGEIDNATLIDAVRFLRSGPTSAPSVEALPPRPWAILTVASAENIATAGGAGGLSGAGLIVQLTPAPSTSARVVLQRSNGTWVIRSVQRFRA